MARSRRSHVTTGSAANVNWVTRCMSRPRSRAMRFFAANAHVSTSSATSGCPSGWPATPTRRMPASSRQPESRICTVSWNSPTGAIPPAISNTSSTPSAASSPSMRPKVARSGTPRAAMCGTGRIPSWATHRTASRVCSHGTFGRNVR